MEAAIPFLSGLVVGLGIVVITFYFSGVFDDWRARRMFIDSQRKQPIYLDGELDAGPMPENTERWGPPEPEKSE